MFSGVRAVRAAESIVGDQTSGLRSKRCAAWGLQYASLPGHSGQQSPQTRLPVGCSRAQHFVHNSANDKEALGNSQPRDALEGKGPQRRPQKRLPRRLEEVAKSIGGGYWRLLLVTNAIEPGT